MIEYQKIQILDQRLPYSTYYCPICNKDAVGELHECLIALDSWSKRYSDKHKHTTEEGISGDASLVVKQVSNSKFNEENTEDMEESPKQPEDTYSTEEEN